ncbi:MAG: hypothetical protein RH981_13245 [Arenibacter sp.]
MDLLEFTERTGERIMEWVDNNFTIQNGLKREPNQDDFDDFGFEEIPWMFTQKGQKLYESYLNKAQKLIERKFPNEEYEDLESYTGVIYP